VHSLQTDFFVIVTSFVFSADLQRVILFANKDVSCLQEVKLSLRVRIVVRVFWE